MCEVTHNIEFSSLKNSNDVGHDCLDTCLRDLSAIHILWIKAAGISVDVEKLNAKNLKLFISPLLSYFGEGLTKDCIKEKIYTKLNVAFSENYSGPKHIII